ncbi:hypothetical protein B0A48_17478 [Cryoendolithus antarcticus]|uniref:Major facilitator superfamily (MFS) profile domain-containing protein n=1 Tax=Cryoendolithus antarcticus TaxID=1507870 RepID=A0A1V8SBB7_9PEZI|nr:hypothetical protein B0A48_17478 [Cryoendolithus antarcticus]
MRVETLQGKADADFGNELTYNEAPSRSRLSRSWRAFRGFIWDDPDKPKAKRWFLFKLDCFFLTIAMLGYFSKNLDQSNVNNAYVSGMKEALGMYESELTYAGNCFTAGYLIGQLPAVMLVTRVRPSLLIPTVELLWTVTTFSASAIKTPGQLYAIRFLVGLFESAYFPCVMYMLGSWYTKEERGKRLTIFYSTTAMSQMFSGYLQAAAYKNLSGVGGREGWSWLFIICSVICLPIGLAGYFCFPDFPGTTRAFYLTKAEVHLARSRLAREGLMPLGASPWNRKKLTRIAGHWQFWLLSPGLLLHSGFLQAIWFTIAVWRTIEAPRFTAGFIFAATLGVAIVSLSLIIRILQSRDEKKRAREGGETNDSSAVSVEGVESGKVADGTVTDVYKGESVATSYA